MVLAGQWSDRERAAGAADHRDRRLRRRAAAVRDRRGHVAVHRSGGPCRGCGGGLVIVALYVVVGRAYPERLRPAIMAAFAASWVVPVGGRAARRRVPSPSSSAGGGSSSGYPCSSSFRWRSRCPQIRRLAGGAAEGGGAREPWDRRRIRLALGISLGRRAAPVRRPGSAVGLGRSRRCRRRAARARRTRAAAPGDLSGRARAAVRRAAARGRRGLVHRRRVLRTADARHPAGAVADDGRVLARGRRGDVGAGVVRAVAAADGAVPGAADDVRDGAGRRRPSPRRPPC